MSTCLFVVPDADTGSWCVYRDHLFFPRFSVRVHKNTDRPSNHESFLSWTRLQRRMGIGHRVTVRLLYSINFNTMKLKIRVIVCV